MATTIRFQLRGDSGENWASKNPKLLKNEPGYDTTANRLKLGDGLHTWNELPYVAPDVVDDLITGGSLVALSAEQGKVLKELIDTKKDDDGSVNNNYRRIICTAGNTSANLNNSKNPTGLDKNIVIPEGVETVYISGCGAGGGLGINGFDYIAGRNGGFCIGAKFPVTAGDVLNVKVGVGGNGQTKYKISGNIITIGSCSRGQDSVVTLNDNEIVRLGGGNGGTDTANQVGETQVLQNLSGANKDYAIYENPTQNTPLQIPEYIYFDNKWTYCHEEKLMRQVGAMTMPQIPFVPFGAGGHFMNTQYSTIGVNVKPNSPNISDYSVFVPPAYRGNNGIVIIEFGLSIIYANNYGVVTP